MDVKYQWAIDNGITKKVINRNEEVDLSKIYLNTKVKRVSYVYLLISCRSLLRDYLAKKISKLKGFGLDSASEYPGDTHRVPTI